VAFGAFLLAVAVREFRLLARRSPDGGPAERDLPRHQALTIGSVMGFLSGLLGIGGGVVGIPLMRTWAHLEMKRAIVTSVCTMVPLTAVGAITKAVTLWRSEVPSGGSALVPTLVIAACLVPTAIMGSWLGASLNLRVTGRAVRWVLASYLPIAAAWMAWPVIASWLEAAK
jgi:uncharacterized membrane protein YfcA